MTQLSNTPVCDIVRKRPLTLALFEALHISVWNHWNWTLSELCHRFNQSVEIVSHEISKLNNTLRQNDWKQDALYHLVDFLTLQHRQEIFPLLSQAGQLLDIHAITEGQNSKTLKALRNWIHKIEGLLDTHSHQQERELFVASLRSDASLKDPAVKPDFDARAFSRFSVMLSQHHSEEKAAIEAVKDHCQLLNMSSIAPEEKILDVCAALCDSYSQHILLEEQVLYPWAKNNEMLLYNLYVSGKRNTNANVGQGTASLRD